MPTRDLHNNIHFARGISPVTQTNSDTALVSQIIDTAMYESVEFVYALGTVSDADVTLAVLFEDGDAANLSDHAAVDDKYLLGTETAAAAQFGDDDGVRKIGYKGSKRYCRVTITPTGNNSGSLPIAALWVLGHPRRKPTATLADA